jgi:hypothetical protein
MNRRLAKEFRAFLLPWCVAVCGGFVGPVLKLLISLKILHEGEFLGFVVGLATFAFMSCLLGIAAIPFGAEIQHSTLPLLLSQPIARNRLLGDKLGASLCGIVSALLLNFLVGSLQFTAESWAVGCGFVIPTLASAAFWTLLARSTLGGMVFTASAQLVIVGVLSYIVQRWEFSAAGQTGMFVGFGLVYSGLFGWLSWRKFLSFEVRQLSEGKAGFDSLAARGWRPDWLRCRSTSGLLNLVRKEIQLQRPLFIISVIFCALWALAYVLMVVQPTRTTYVEIIFALTIGAYIPLTAVLAGCISLSEEKNLGLTAWHHTFPVSIRRQWAIKLGVGFLTWLLLGLVLPNVLIRLGSAIDNIRLLRDERDATWLIIAVVGSSLFITTFWAMTLAMSAIRAVIGGLVLLMCLGGAVSLGIWVASLLFGNMIYLTLFSWPLIGLLIISPLLMTLAQSVRQFGRLQSSRRIALEHSVMLITLTFLTVLGYFVLISVLGFPVGKLT